jgi:hypothetical protein
MQLNELKTRKVVIVPKCQKCGRAAVHMCNAVVIVPATWQCVAPSTRMLVDDSYVCRDCQIAETHPKGKKS